MKDGVRKDKYGDQWSTCPECGNEQPDMGQGVKCEECGHGSMPTDQGEEEPKKSTRLRGGIRKP